MSSSRPRDHHDDDDDDIDSTKIRIQVNKKNESNKSNISSTYPCHRKSNSSWQHTVYESPFDTVSTQDTVLHVALDSCKTSWHGLSQLC